MNEHTNNKPGKLKTTSSYFRLAFVFLLPVFFVLHGYLDFFEFVFLDTCLKLLGEYLLVTSLLLFVFWLFYRSLGKAAFVSFVLMAFHFCFGFLHDSLKNWLGDHLLTRYTFLLTAASISVILLFWQVKKKRLSGKLFTFLTLLLIMLIVVDLVRLTVKYQQRRAATTEWRKNNRMVCHQCDKPDVYLIMTDGYSGNEVLKNRLHFDNSWFENELRKRQFHLIQKSSSNYNVTPFSMASLFNYDYLTGVEMNHRNRDDIARCYQLINQNKVVANFESLGYRTVNFSIFNFAGQETDANSFTLFPVKEKSITSQTFFSRLWRDLGYHLATDFNLWEIVEKRRFATWHDNQAFIQRLLEESRKKNSQPRFIYTHLVMPHYPYYTDRFGKMKSVQEFSDFEKDAETNYIAYLQYSNGRFLSLIDQLQKETAGKAIILFMSDHGFREFETKVDKRLFFSTINAIYLPDQQYDRFYEGMSNVNQFRVLFNTQFGQSFPLRKDSIVLVR